ncbi:laccase-12-like [Cryptomeria japonica]|uniref:laccase-12-like n=1 Tax=Cryptomeria japonica TaxID=3369 RepID=UPI0027DA89EF|nr:laccase-12-like [Cryptomeria japonica]
MFSNKTNRTYSNNLCSLFISKSNRASIILFKFYKLTFIKETPITRQCQRRNIITVNGQFPGPTLYVHRGDTLIVKTYNTAPHNATIHWHGVRQIRSGWADGPGYITQCPIQQGGNYTYRFTIVAKEGTLWWHAHVSWLRATVHGALVIYPQKGRSYPFPKPHAEIPIVLGQWWNSDPEAVEMQSILTGAAPNVSNGFTIDGQPGYLYPCSKSGTSKISVEQGRTYLLRIVNAAVNNHLFFKIASHNLTVVAVDACYTKPYTTDIMLISPGQTADVLLTADQPLAKYYIAAKAYTTQAIGSFDNTTTTAILSYVGSPSSATPSFPQLPEYNDTATVTEFNRALRSLASPEHPVNVPKTIDEELFITVGLGLFPCRTNLTTNCQGPNNTRLTASLNNVSLVLPDIAILQAYYFGVNGVFTTDFPSNPPVVFNYTGDDIPKSLWAPITGTKVYVLDYNSTVEVVFQGTNIFQPDDHPMHLHGYDFYIVGEGFGNYNAETDPLTFNLVDPPQRNTVGVPVTGWSAIRFKADNPGVWFMHCHFDDHVTWGLNMVFVVKNGPGYLASLEPPPNDLPRC